MTWIVDTKIINGYGICLGEELIGEDYKPYVDTDFTFSGPDEGTIYFRTYQGTGAANYLGRRPYTHQFGIDLFTLVRNYIRQVYNLSDDTEINLDYGDVWGSFFTDERGTQQTFETEAEALEYVDTLGNTETVLSIPAQYDDYQMFTANWRQEINGTFITRSIELNHAGDPIDLYTIPDLVNFLALFFEVTPEEIPVEYTLFGSQDISEPSLDCEPYINCLLYTSPSPRDRQKSRMPSSA